MWFANVGFGNQTQYLLVDTGSPWTWTVTNDTVCYDALVGGRTRCSAIFGIPYAPSSTLVRYNGTDNQARYSYADLSVVRGTYGFENMVFGGSFSLDQVPFVLATTTVMTSMWPGTGIFGLSPDLSADADFTASLEDISLRQIPSTRSDLLISRPQHPNAAAVAADSPRDSVLTDIFNHTNLPAFFGLAMSRTSANSTWGGLLTIGESLDISLPYVNATGPYVQVPLEPYVSSTGASSYTSYITNATALAIGRDRRTTETYAFTNGADTPFLFDSGHEVNFVPHIHAALIASRFNPPGYLDRDSWFVDCDATPPADVALIIYDEPFYINPLDMVLRKEATNRTTVCLSAFQGDYQSKVLGSPFLKNVYVETFREDYVGEESATMWIASREFYQT